MKSALLSVWVFGVLVAGACVTDRTAGASEQPGAAAQAPPPTGATDSAVEANKEPGLQDDSTASRNAARTRMRECGHQWSSMKKSGAANGMTWKDFSQNCLARK